MGLCEDEGRERGIMGLFGLEFYALTVEDVVRDASIGALMALVILICVNVYRMRRG